MHYLGYVMVRINLLTSPQAMTDVLPADTGSDDSDFSNVITIDVPLTNTLFSAFGAASCISVT